VPLAPSPDWTLVSSLTEVTVEWLQGLVSNG